MQAGGRYTSDRHSGRTRSRRMASMRMRKKVADRQWTMDIQTGRQAVGRAGSSSTIDIFRRLYNVHCTAHYIVIRKAGGMQT